MSNNDSEASIAYHAEMKRLREADAMLAAIERHGWIVEPAVPLSGWAVIDCDADWTVEAPTLRAALAAAMKRQEGGE